MINRTALFVGASLAVAGTVMLVGLGDAAAGDALSQAVRLWPLAVIALGVGLVVRRTRFAVAGTLAAAITGGLVLGGAVVAAPDLDAFCDGREGDAALTRNGVLAAGPTAAVDVAIDCGDLTITTVDGTAWELRSLDLGDGSAVVRDGDDALEIRSPNRRWGGGMDRYGDDWQLALPTGVRLALDAEVNAGHGRFDLLDGDFERVAVEVNAGDAWLDLGGSTVDELALDVHAGAATVVLPSSDLVGDVEVAAGSIEICAPAGLGLRVRGDADLGSIDVNGLVRVANAWETPDLSTAPYVAELSVSAQAGSVVVNPAGGCK